MVEERTRAHAKFDVRTQGAADVSNASRVMREANVAHAGTSGACDRDGSTPSQHRSTRPRASQTQVVLGTPDLNSRHADGTEKCHRPTWRSGDERRVAHDCSQQCCPSYCRAGSWQPSAVCIRVTASADATASPAFGPLAPGPESGGAAVPRVTRHGSAGWVPNHPNP